MVEQILLDGNTNDKSLNTKTTWKPQNLELKSYDTFMICSRTHNHSIYSMLHVYNCINFNMGSILKIMGSTYRDKQQPVMCWLMNAQILKMIKIINANTYYRSDNFAHLLLLFSVLLTTESSSCSFHEDSVPSDGKKGGIEDIVFWFEVVEITEVKYAGKQMLNWYFS